MNKAEADKASRKMRERLQARVRRALLKGSSVREVSDATGYTTSRVYQIKKAMVAAGELKP